MHDLKGKTALVTGASSGLGVAFAHRLAALGADLVITARREEKLNAVARAIEERYRVKVDVIVLDLAQPGAARTLYERTEGAGRPIDVLVNNAGGGIHQNFLDVPWEETARQMQLNMTSLTEATYLFAKRMLARGGGYILNVSSIGAYTPTPTYATYAAGKAFVRDFTEALAHELAGTPVRVCCLCPGGTLTDFHDAAGHELPRVMRATFMTADVCAKIGLDALLSGRRNVVSGASNAFSMFLLRFMPRRLIVWVAALTMGKPRGRPTALLTERSG